MIDGSIDLYKDFYTMDKEQQWCTIAHELTHYLQFVNKADPIICKLEPPAYTVGAVCFHMLSKSGNEKWSYEQAEIKGNCK